jgi:hypothetical protein
MTVIRAVFSKEKVDEYAASIQSLQAPTRKNRLRCSDHRVDRLKNMRPRRESNPLIAVLRTAAFPLGYVATRTVIVRCVVCEAFVRHDRDLPCHEAKS